MRIVVVVVAADGVLDADGWFVLINLPPRLRLRLRLRLRVRVRVLRLYVGIGWELSFVCLYLYATKINCRSDITIIVGAILLLLSERYYYYYIIYAHLSWGLVIVSGLFDIYIYIYSV